MTTPTTPAVAPSATESDDTPDPGTSGPLDGPEGHEAPKGNKEAKYRTERNAAREELTAANARIEQMQRAEIERHAADHLAAPADFWLSQNAVADYLTDDGNVDIDRVVEDARLLINERPRLGKHVPAFDPSQGLHHPGGKAEPTWGGLLKP